VDGSDGNIKPGSGFLNSLRGRYLATAGVLVLVILCSAWAAQFYLSRTEVRSRINLKERNEVTEYSRQIHNAIWQAADAQKAFLLTPSQKYQQAFNAFIDSALHSTSALEKTAWVHSTKLENGIRRLVDSLPGHENHA